MHVSSFARQVLPGGSALRRVSFALRRHKSAVAAHATMSRQTSELNVLGTPLSKCCDNPPTGFYRDGCCTTGPTDFGRHVVCAVVTDAFLKFTASRGNDLVTPRPEYSFPGLKAGSRWCLCAQRWTEAFEAGVAPPVVLSATSAAALNFTTLAALQANAYPE
jgi:uncharacterized protein